MPLIYVRKKKCVTVFLYLCTFWKTIKLPCNPVFIKQRPRKYSKTDHNFQEELRVVRLWLFEIISESRIYGPMSYGRGN